MKKFNLLLLALSAAILFIIIRFNKRKANKEDPS